MFSYYKSINYGILIIFLPIFVQKLSMETYTEVIKVERKYTKNGELSFEEINVTWCDELCYKQCRNITYNYTASETKVNEFLNWLNSNVGYDSSNDSSQVSGNVGKSLNLVTQSRFKAFNFKIKFLHFFRKHFFLRSKSATTDKV